MAVGAFVLAVIFPRLRGSSMVGAAPSSHEDTKRYYIFFQGISCAGLTRVHRVQYNGIPVGPGRRYPR